MGGDTYELWRNNGMAKICIRTIKLLKKYLIKNQIDLKDLQLSKKSNRC